jgi:4-amino-4-deoxy-L-arabinose transferase-like glycosyltransferase
MGYVLVPTVLTGAHEWTAHLTQLVLVWIAIVAMTSLIFRLGWGRWHATAGALLLVAVPPFLPMASTAMPDILATAVALVAMERLAAWKQEKKWTQGVAAAIALGLAGFARSHLALLLPLAAFFLIENIDPGKILQQVRRKVWIWWPVFAGFGVLLALILAVREHNLAINPPPVVTGIRYIPVNLFSYLLYLAFPLPLAACWLANRFKSRRLGVAFILLGAGVLAWLLRSGQPFAVFLAVLGCGALIGLILEAWRKRDQFGLFLLLWLLIPLPIVYYVHLPVKYLLPCTPAVILTCFRLMESFSARVARTAAVALIVAGTGYSFLILRSDAEFAEFGRGAMFRLISPHVAAGQKVWFGGQYWSYWYAPAAGATLTYIGGPQPKPGDLLVVGMFGGGGVHSPLERFPHRTLVEAISQNHRFGRIYNGLWLWGFGDSENDRYELWRID